ncbi:N-formylglutamate amidohydrolase [Hyphomonas neptunium ATCC 15444]|uniref:N-formylglutamate amidohydrolase n=2 Tax=Hyphomonas TaxID=85 RepID=Q0BZK1_HYPNA|nr:MULTISPECIES: N-formylglutamate deformylase [Hyphomonas]ABI78362.1 N-formylglutamate amidohydrolase [Hyphomonas neptunium ATCC 15444]KCZ95182.1 N-formylglutamate amidohydrolase [Hyphomonas hirschiana VP5]
MTGWLTVKEGPRPLIICFPHTGTVLPEDVADHFVSPELARRDTDWWVDKLYAFAGDMGATLIHTAISRSVIDVNRDPSGASLYPGQNTTTLCPLTTFDGAPLYKPGHPPNDADIARRRAAFHIPYHHAIEDQISRLRARHEKVVLYDAHSIRSEIPDLFDGLLPVFNVGSNYKTTCAPQFAENVEAICAASGQPSVLDGRFRGGWTVRHHGQPDHNVHAIQMELSCRGYMRESIGAVDDTDWPVPFDADYAAPMTDILKQVLGACLAFAENA